MKNRNKRLIKILTKKFLIKEYIKNKKSIGKIAKEAGCSETPIINRLKKYNIKTRTIQEGIKLLDRTGTNNPNFGNHKLAGIKHPEHSKRMSDNGNSSYIDGRSLKKHYCIDCLKKGIKKEITWQSAIYRSGLCHSCALKERFKDPKNHPNWKGDKALIKQKHYCKEKDCNNEISYSNWKRGKGRCSSCAIKNWLKDPKKHPSYKGGIGKLPYGFDFTQELKEQIRQRDNCTCQVCGVKQKDYYRKLDIHHIDYNKKNCNEENLITLCQRGNLKANYNRDYWYAYFRYIMENWK